MTGSHWMPRISLAAIALTFLVAGCDGPGDPAAMLAPKHDQEQVLISWKYGNGYTVVRETDNAVGSVEAVIGSAGGVLSMGKHLLIVPENAVSASTTFRMSKVDGDHVRLHLTASRNGNNDVGSRGFDRPVRLMLSFEGAANVRRSDVGAMAVMYIRSDNRVEPLPSMVNVNDRWVGADLVHFSEYGIGWPNFGSTGNP